MKKLIVFLVASVMATMGMAQNYDFSAEAPSGQTLYYRIVDGEAHLVYPGFNNYVSGDLVIPSEVTYNGMDYPVTMFEHVYDNTRFMYYGVFQSCSGLTSVTIPNTMTNIGISAFDCCSALEFVSIPNSVTVIGIFAFTGCHRLTSITIPNSVVEIGDAAFASSGLISLTIPASVSNIENNPFYACDNLTSIVVETGNMYYDSREDCNAIIRTEDNCLVTGCVNTVIPNTVTTIGYLAFNQCRNLRYISIPNSVTTIENSAFSGCRDLLALEIPNSVTSIEINAFDQCTNLTSVTIPANVTYIGQNPFAGCRGLTSIVVEPGNRYYDSRENCNAIIQTNNNCLITGCENTIIPNTVSSIGINAFWLCNGLTSLLIPGSVTAIGDYALAGCSNLTTITCLAEMPPTVTTSYDGRWFERVPADIPLYVPCGSRASYQSATGWSYFTNIQEITVCTHNITVTSSNDTWGTVVGGGEITSGETVTLTATPNCGYRFVGWKNTSGEIVSTDNPLDITVSNDTSLVAEFSDQIQIDATTGQTLVYSINCTDNTATIIGHNGACAGDLELPSSISIDGNTYAVASIAGNAFQYCSGLTSVTIPTSITSVGYNAFVGCWNIVVNYLGTIDQWCTLIDYDVWANPTYYASSLIVNGSPVTHLIIPEGVTEIKPMAFDAYNGLLSVVIPNTVTSIGGNAFYRCHYLTTVTIGSSVNNIENYAFLECERLTSVTVLATEPPTIKNMTFVEARTNATLYVPCGRVDAYRSAYGWSGFANIQEIAGCSPTGSTRLSIYVEGSDIVVNGADGNMVTLFDATGNEYASQLAPYGTPLHFEWLASGTYYVKIGVLPARLKVEVR